MVNGVTQLIMMKSDVLDDFETIKACVAYKVNGEEIDYFRSAIIVNQRAPVRMFALTLVQMLIQTSAVKTGKSMFVFWKMRRYPV